MRHAHTEWNSEPKKFQGHFDVHLSEKGKQEALLRSRSMSAFEYVYSSTASRCTETANILLGDSEKIILDKRLLEIDTGEFTGKTNKEVAINSSKWWRTWKNNPKSSCFPQGESLDKLLVRVVDFFDELLINHSEKDKILILTHGGPIRVCKAILYSGSINYFWDFPIDNLDEFSIKRNDVELLLKNFSRYRV